MASDSLPCSLIWKKDLTLTTNGDYLGPGSLIIWYLLPTRLEYHGKFLEIFGVDILLSLLADNNNMMQLEESFLFKAKWPGNFQCVSKNVGWLQVKSFADKNLEAHIAYVHDRIRKYPNNLQPEKFPKWSLEIIFLFSTIVQVSAEQSGLFFTPERYMIVQKIEFVKLFINDASRAKNRGSQLFYQPCDGQRLSFEAFLFTFV